MPVCDRTVVYVIVIVTNCTAIFLCCCSVYTSCDEHLVPQSESIWHVLWVVCSSLLMSCYLVVNSTVRKSPRPFRRCLLTGRQADNSLHCDVLLLTTFSITAGLQNGSKSRYWRQIQQRCATHRRSIPSNAISHGRLPQKRVLVLCYSLQRDWPHFTTSWVVNYLHPGLSDEPARAACCLECAKEKLTAVCMCVLPLLSSFLWSGMYTIIGK